jgi:hypothetical protein
VEFGAGDLYAGGGDANPEGDSFMTQNVRFGGVDGIGGGILLEGSAGECD